MLYYSFYAASPRPPPQHYKALWEARTRKKRPSEWTRAAQQVQSLFFLSIVSMVN